MGSIPTNNLLAQRSIFLPISPTMIMTMGSPPTIPETCPTVCIGNPWHRYIDNGREAIIFFAPCRSETAMIFRSPLVAGLAAVAGFFAWRPKRRAAGRVGKDAGAPTGRWLETNGPTLEKTLMSWDNMPSLAALKQLPQSK